MPTNYLFVYPTNVVLEHSPLYSIQNLPTIASIPVLRTAGLLACAVDVTALVTSSAFRLRLKLLRGKGLDEGFAQVTSPAIAHSGHLC